MKTAIEDLIEEFERFSKFPMVDTATIEAVIEFAKLRIDLNKKQINQILVDYTNRIVENVRLGDVEDSDEYMKCIESITSQLEPFLKEKELL